VADRPEHPEPAEPWDDPRITAFGMFIEAFSAVMTKVQSELDRTAGVPVTWFEVLLRLARSPQHRLRMAELARQVGLSTSGLTRLIDRVEDAGYVRREVCDTDRRGAHAVLTGDGMALLRAALPPHLDCVERHVASPLGPELATFERLLRTLRDANDPCAPGC
jgi:MarR family 2-MHQ and catechol resistance regulon transcriptional repressor